MLGPYGVACHLQPGAVVTVTVTVASLVIVKVAGKVRDVGDTLYVHPGT